MAAWNLHEIRRSVLVVEDPTDTNTGSKSTGPSQTRGDDLDTHSSDSSDSSATIVLIVAYEPRPPLRVEETTPGWEDLVADRDEAPATA